jgi:uncharacterized protein (TIRG00374 family)
MTPKNSFRLLLSLACSALFLWLAFRHVDLSQVAQTLRHVSLGYVALYVVALMLIQVCRSLRWEVLVRPFAPLSQRTAFKVSNVGNMLIMLLPLRLGELSRPYLMKKISQASFTSTMGAVAVERIVDGLLVTLLFFMTTWFLGPEHVVPSSLRIGAFLALGVFGGATVGVVLALVSHTLATRLLRRLLEPLSAGLCNKVVALLDAFVAGLRALPNLRAVLALVFWTLAYWAANGLGLWSLMLGFGWSLPPSAGFTLVCVLVIFIMMPAGPGFLGTYQSAINTGLAIFGVGQSEAAAYGVVAYPLNLLVVVGFGLPYLLGRRGLHVGEMVRESAG